MRRFASEPLYVEEEVKTSTPKHWAQKNHTRGMLKQQSTPTFSKAVGPQKKDLTSQPILLEPDQQRPMKWGRPSKTIPDFNHTHPRLKTLTVCRSPSPQYSPAYKQLSWRKKGVESYPVFQRTFSFRAKRTGFLTVSVMLTTQERIL